MARIGTIIIALFILITLGFNIGSLASTKWYSKKYSVTVPSNETYILTWGLLSSRLCVSGDGIESTCETTAYSDIDTSDLNESDKKDLNSTRAGGALAIMFLILNILACVFLLYVTASNLDNGLSKIFGAKFEGIVNSFQNKEMWFPTFIFPFQLMAFIFWASLFGYYDYGDGEIDMGTGSILLLFSLDGGLFAFVIASCIFFRKRNCCSYQRVPLNVTLH